MPQLCPYCGIIATRHTNRLPPIYTSIKYALFAARIFAMMMVLDASNAYVRPTSTRHFIFPFPHVFRWVHPDVPLSAIYHHRLRYFPARVHCSFSARFFTCTPHYYYQPTETLTPTQALYYYTSNNSSPPRMPTLLHVVLAVDYHGTFLSCTQVSIEYEYLLSVSTFEIVLRQSVSATPRVHQTSTSIRFSC